MIQLKNQELFEQLERRYKLMGEIREQFGFSKDGKYLLHDNKVYDYDENRKPKMKLFTDDPARVKAFEIIVALKEWL